MYNPKCGCFVWITSAAFHNSFCYLSQLLFKEPSMYCMKTLWPFPLSLNKLQGNWTSKAPFCLPDIYFSNNFFTTLWLNKVNKIIFYHCYTAVDVDFFNSYFFNIQKLTKLSSNSVISQVTRSVSGYMLCTDVRCEKTGLFLKCILRKLQNLLYTDRCKFFIWSLLAQSMKNNFSKYLAAFKHKALRGSTWLFRPKVKAEVFS